MVNRRVIGAAVCVSIAGVFSAVLSGAPPGAVAPPPYPRQAAAGHHTPAWSIDDRAITYMTLTPGAGPGTLFTVPASKGEAVRLFHDDHHYAMPAWSPDGRRLAFASDRSGSWAIWTSLAGGAEARAIAASQFAEAFAPAWSPDGSRVIYSATTPSGPVLMMTPADGTAGTPTRLWPGWRARWSPDGTRIAFTDRFREGGRELEAIAIAAVDGTASRRLRSTTAPLHNPHLSADWSPDGRRLVVPRRNGARSDILAVDVVGDMATVIGSVEGFAFDPSWSHDGTRIAFSSEASDHPAEIHVVPAGGGSDVIVTRQPRGAHAKRIDYRGEGNVRIPAWLYEPVPGGSRHPALVWVHGGGPGEGSADDQYDTATQYFVRQGYVVLAPNYRGSIGYGDAVATISSPADAVGDLVAAGQYLRSLPSVDPARVGILGFSAGGFWTTLTIGTVPSTFTAAVDFFGPTDLLEMYRFPPTRPLVERLLGSPAEHEAAYRDASPLSHAGSIAIPVLVLHGKTDRTIPFDQSVRFVDALRAAGKTVQFEQFEGGHGFTGEENAVAFEKVASFLAEHLH